MDNQIEYGYTLFDRHANMNVETLQEVGSIINKLTMKMSDNLVGHTLLNQMYGLYDGYLYTDNVELAELLYRSKDISKSMLNKIKSVCQTAKSYPAIGSNIKTI